MAPNPSNGRQWWEDGWITADRPLRSDCMLLGDFVQLLAITEPLLKSIRPATVAAAAAAAEGRAVANDMATPGAAGCPPLLPEAARPPPRTAFDPACQQREGKGAPETTEATAAASSVRRSKSQLQREIDEQDLWRQQAAADEKKALLERAQRLAQAAQQTLTAYDDEAALVEHAAESLYGGGGATPE